MNYTLIALLFVSFTLLSLVVRARAAERIREARGKISYGAPMTSLLKKKTKNRRRVLQSVEKTSKRGS